VQIDGMGKKKKVAGLAAPMKSRRVSRKVTTQFHRLTEKLKTAELSGDNKVAAQVSTEVMLPPHSINQWVSRDSDSLTPLCVWHSCRLRRWAGDGATKMPASFPQASTAPASGCFRC
jgi:hypothetical protein